MEVGAIGLDGQAVLHFAEEDFKVVPDPAIPQFLLMAALIALEIPPRSKNATLIIVPVRKHLNLLYRRNWI